MSFAELIRYTGTMVEGYGCADGIKLARSGELGEEFFIVCE